MWTIELERHVIAQEIQVSNQKLVASEPAKPNQGPAKLTTFGEKPSLLLY